MSRACSATLGHDLATKEKFTEEGEWGRSESRISRNLKQKNAQIRILNQRLMVVTRFLVEMS